MGRSKSSCLKIIACGSDSANKDEDTDDLQATTTEAKLPVDKCGWSFRKRSARQQVLSNNASTETPSPTTNVENPKSTSFKFLAATDPIGPKRISAVQWKDEVAPVSTALNSSIPDPIIATENACKIDPLVSTGYADKIDSSAPLEVAPLSSTAVSSSVPDPVIAAENTCKIDPLVSTENTWEATPLPTEGSSNLPDPIIANGSTTKNASLMSTEKSSITDSPTYVENATKMDLDLDESVVVVLQAAIRAYLAKRAHLKLKNVIKLQAAVRGHLTRNQAVGTLRCVQAIVKMQSLVRARRVRSLCDPVSDEKLEGNQENDHQTPLVKLEPKADAHYASTQRLLSNGFARQLLESAPKKKQIRVKCDPSRSDSSWKWFDRWTSVSSSKFTQPQKPEPTPDAEEQGKWIASDACGVETEVPSRLILESGDTEPSIEKTTMEVYSDENSIIYYTDNFDFKASPLISSSISDNKAQSQQVDVGVGGEQETSLMIDAKDAKQAEMQLDAASQITCDAVSNSNEFHEDSEQLKKSVTSMPSEQSDTEGKKIKVGSRKASKSPAFLAAKSKFEDLSLRATSDRSISSRYHDVASDTKSESSSSSADSVEMTKEHSYTDNSVSYYPRAYAGSECGTELSISSTLDSPARSELGGESEGVVKAAEKITSHMNCSTDNASNVEHLDVGNEDSTPQPISPHPVAVCPEKVEDVIKESADKVISDENGNLKDAYLLGNLNVDTINDLTLEPTEPHPVSILQEKVESVDRESGDSLLVENSSIEQRPERAASDVQTQMKTEVDYQPHRSSIDESPRAPTTTPAFQETPSSQISVKSRKKKQDKSLSPQIKKSPSVVKKSPSNLNPDSPARKSTEKLPKEPKSGKRRSSFGSTKPDHIEVEPRLSSSNSLPSYMQATQSAKAKAHAISSPRPRTEEQDKQEKQDKETYLKKRHSLPATNGKQGSPRVQTTPQKQQRANGNRTHSPW